jgi:hypothetical protein
LLSSLRWEKTFGSSFPPTDNILAAVLYSNSVLLLDPYSLKPIGQPIADKKVDIVKFSSDGRLIAFSAYTEVTVLEYPSMNLVVKFSSDDIFNETFRKKDKDFRSTGIKTLLLAQITKKYL